jgi:hypothetical protein
VRANAVSIKSDPVSSVAKNVEAEERVKGLLKAELKKRGLG